MNFSKKNHKHQKNSIKMVSKIYIIAALLLSTSLISAQTSSGKYTIKNLNINTKYADLGAAYFGDSTIIFSSPRGKSMIKNIWKPNKQPYLNLYIGEIAFDGEVINKKNMKRGLNSKFHEANVIFTKDLKTVYFTRNNYYKNEVKNDSAGILKLQLFKATIDVKGEWTNIEKLPFNSDQYSTGHPALSNDEKKLYFVSDRPESIGKSDIYVTNINEDGTYSEPINLGGEINTVEKEMFPFMGKDGILYFSSEGYKGNGGLDVFASKFYTTTYSKPLNLGKEINSEKDDFAYIVNAKNTKGYFSSNRKGGKGDDDIYSFSVEESLKIQCQQMVTGGIIDNESKEVVVQAQVVLLDADGNEVDSTVTDEKGMYTFNVDCGAKYSVKVSKENFKGSEVPLNVAYDVSDETINVGFNLIPDIDLIIASLKIEPIYYELNKWQVSTDAEKIIEILKKYPQISIEAYSHTDSRASKVYNNRLSKKRAKAIEKYLSDKGIELTRINSQWFGEEKLVNTCSNGVKCAEVEHQKNRRTEFLIVRKK